MSPPPETPATIAELIDGFFARWMEQHTVLGILEVVSVGMLVVIGIEVAWDYFTKRRSNLWEPLANGSFMLLTRLLEKTVYGIVLVGVFAWLEPRAWTTIPMTAWSWISCLILCDFTYYWMHRAEHRIRLLWTLHSVHHSSQEYDLSTSLRVFWFIDLSILFFFAPLVLIGFSGPQVLSCMLTVFTYMIWIHTTKIDKLGWFDRIFSSPANHRVHHGTNEQYIDKNYAGILVIWDRMFGTYEPEREPVRYGLTAQINTSNPIRIGFHGIFTLLRQMFELRDWRDRLLLPFRPPEWTPAGTTAENGPPALDRQSTTSAQWSSNT